MVCRSCSEEEEIEAANLVFFGERRGLSEGRRYSVDLMGLVLVRTALELGTVDILIVEDGDMPLDCV